MKKVPLAEFKAHCSRYVEEVADEEILITKHGKRLPGCPPQSRERACGTFVES